MELNYQDYTGWDSSIIIAVGFCCKAGQSHWINVLEKMPDKFREYEEAEQEVIKHIRKRCSYDEKTKNKITTPYTLNQLRIDYENRKY